MAQEVPKHVGEKDDNLFMYFIVCVRYIRMLKT